MPADCFWLALAMINQQGGILARLKSGAGKFNKFYVMNFAPVQSGKLLQQGREVTKEVIYLLLIEPAGKAHMGQAQEVR